MIQHPWQLAKTREHLTHMEDALLSLRSEYREVDPGLLRVMAQGFVDQIEQLRGEMDEYLGVGEIVSQQVDLRARLVGPGVRFGSVPASVVGGFTDSLRKSVQAVAAALARRTSLGDVTAASLRDLCDFSLVDWAHGSVAIELALPGSLQPPLPEVGDTPEEVVLQATRLLMAEAEATMRDPGERPQESVDTELRLTVMRSLRKLAPTASSRLTEVEFTGKVVPGTGRCRLDAESRGRIKKRMADIVQTSTRVLEERQGVVGEVDATNGRLRLESLTGTPRKLTCRFPEDLLEDARRVLGRRAHITGELTTNSLQDTQEMAVHLIESAEDADDFAEDRRRNEVLQASVA